MAEHQSQSHPQENNASEETTDRGMFDFMKKKDDDVPMVEAKKPKEDKHRFMEQLHGSDSHSISSSDEEEGSGEKKKKKKKGLKEKIKEKVSGENEGTEHKETSMPVESAEEKKGFLDEIKEKLPGHHKNAEEGGPKDGHHTEGEPKEKGFLEKIKDKIHGSHKSEEERSKDS